MKNLILRVAFTIIALTLITSCFVGSTFAKYVTSVTAKDEAVIARWVIKQDGVEIKDTVEFNLFDANTVVYLGTDGTLTETPANLGTDDDTGKPIIAPGTGGSFSFKLENASDVAARCIITLGSEFENLPLEFTSNPEDSGSWTSIDEFLSDTSIDKGGEETIVVYWRWVASAGDAGFIGLEDEDRVISITASFEITQQ